MKYFFIATLVFTSSLFGETVSLNLAETIQKALRESEDLQIQKNETVKSKYKTKETSSLLFPQVTGELTYLDNFHYPDLPTTRMIKDFTLDAGISINQILLTFGKLSSSISAMKKFTSMNKFREESVKDEVVFNSKLLYYNAYFAKRVLQITKESYENTLKNKALLEQGSEMGRLSKRDAIKVEADVAARIPMIANAESSYTTSLESLRKATGIDTNFSIELTEGYPAHYETSDLHKALANLELNQPILKALQQSINAQKDLVKSKQAEYFPTLSAFFRYNYKGGSDNYFIGNDTLFNYGSAGLNLQIPLFYGGRTRDRIKQAVADKDNAILTYKKTKKNLELELEKAITEYQELTQTLPANEKAEKLAEESFRLSQNLFASGQLSATDLNDAEMMLTSQKLKKETSLFKLQVVLAKIERLAGMGNLHE
jgi:outer membrane protein